MLSQKACVVFEFQVSEQTFLEAQLSTKMVKSTYTLMCTLT